MMIDYDGTLPVRSKADSTSTGSDVPSGVAAQSSLSKVPQNEDDVFSDSEGEETGASRSRQVRATPGVGPAQPGHTSNTTADQMRTLTHRTEQLLLMSQESSQINASKEPAMVGVQNPASGPDIHKLDSVGESDIKAIAADASVFTFGDDEDYESE